MSGISGTGFFLGHNGDHMRSPAKLTPAQRDEIQRRYAEGETASSLALEFGVTTRLIRDLGGRRS